MKNLDEWMNKFTQMFDFIKMQIFTKMKKICRGINSTSTDVYGWMWMGECYLMNVIRCEWLIHHQDKKIQPECEWMNVKGWMGMNEWEWMNVNGWMGMGECEWVKVNGWMKMGECELWMGEWKWENVNCKLENMTGYL